jgi:hypothetical protein
MRKLIATRPFESIPVRNSIESTGAHNIVGNQRDVLNPVRLNSLNARQAARLGTDYV